MTKVRHILGISGGKDSAALAIYLKQKTGLHNKKRSRGVFIYNNLYVH